MYPKKLAAYRNSRYPSLACPTHLDATKNFDYLAKSRKPIGDLAHFHKIRALNEPEFRENNCRFLQKPTRPPLRGLAEFAKCFPSLSHTDRIRNIVCRCSDSLGFFIRHRNCPFPAEDKLVVRPAFEPKSVVAPASDPHPRDSVSGSSSTTGNIFRGSLSARANVRTSFDQCFRRRDRASGFAD